MDRLLAVAHAWHRALLSNTSSQETRAFWRNRFFEIACELDVPDAMNRFETFIAVSYWE